MRSRRPMTVACLRSENSASDCSAISTGAGAAAGERHGKEVHQRLLGLVADRLGDVVAGKLDGEAGELLRGAGAVQHGAVLEIATTRA
jgi:hypothetical protein